MKADRVVEMRQSDYDEKEAEQSRLRASLAVYEGALRAVLTGSMEILRDTDQNDATGYRICSDNMRVIAAADVVHVVWDGKSQGCLFDLGVAFALGKTIKPLHLPPLTEGKSFQNMVMEWAKPKP